MSNHNHPLLTAQLEVWLKQQFDPEKPIYSAGQYLYIRGAMDPALFEAALRRVIEEAETLRVRILEEQDGPRQVVGDFQEWSLPFIDFSAEEDPLGFAESWMKSDLARVFDLKRDRLFNFVLIKTGPERYLWYQRVHHIINDGFSLWLIARRVAEVYTSKVNNLPENGRAFGSLALLLEDEKKYRASEQFARDRQYWLECLAEMSEPVSLADRPPVRSGGFLRQTAYIQPLDADLLRAAAHSAEATLSQVLTAATAAYLNRLTGADEIILGQAVTTRLSASSRKIPGMLSNILPLPLNVLSDMTVSELVQQVAQRTLQALLHQRYRSEELRRELGLVATNRRLFGPTVNVMLFDYDLSFAGHPSTQHNLSNGVIDDISIVVYGRSKDDGLRIDFDSNPDLYTVEELATHQQRFIRFFESLVSNAERRIGQIDLLTAAERSQILDEWNRTRREIPQVTVVELFGRQVERRPEAVAVIHGDQQLTYRELERSANRLACYLRTLGVGPEVRVGICLERSLELVVGLLGILKAGGAYVPLDAAYPVERKAFMMIDSEVKIILSTTVMELPEMLLVTRINLDQITAPATAPDGGGADDPGVTLSGEALAYLMYTSGSTGRPKGIMVPHRAIGRLVLNCGYADFNESDRVAFAANPAFDAATMEVWAPVLNGGRIVVIDQNCLLDPGLFAQALMRYEINVLWLTAGLFKQYADLLTRPFGRLRYLIVGGDVLDPRVIARVLGGSPPQHLVNGYGPTETTTFAVTHEVTEVSAGAKSIPLGRPISNTRIYVLDASLQPAPAGVSGELYIGGAGVAHGYLNRPELTAERFLPDSFGRERGERLYRTGDLGRWLSNGTIEFLGRNDFQVKI
ncbi:MAG TPA: amino acid adenylation domain-containing protein, partial [Blastocatellia bacterium]|nr:amino acid adenylation domain-containing protein [Blastocatellia bacterium]